MFLINRITSRLARDGDDNYYYTAECLTLAPDESVTYIRELRCHQRCEVHIYAPRLCTASCGPEAGPSYGRAIRKSAAGHVHLRYDVKFAGIYSISVLNHSQTSAEFGVVISAWFPRSRWLATATSRLIDFWQTRKGILIWKGTVRR